MTETIRICPSCDKDLSSFPSDIRICPYCGSKLEIVPPPYDDRYPWSRGWQPKTREDEEEREITKPTLTSGQKIAIGLGVILIILIVGAVIFSNPSYNPSALKPTASFDIFDVRSDYNIWYDKWSDKYALTLEGFWFSIKNTGPDIRNVQVSIWHGESMGWDTWKDIGDLKSGETKYDIWYNYYQTPIYDFPTYWKITFKIRYNEGSVVSITRTVSIG